MRILKGEVHRHTGKSSITLLLDLKGFYENVDHVELVEKAMELGHPAILLQGALQLYQGHKHLVTENTVSQPLVATKGILAGFPLAPGLSKIVLHNVVEPLWHGPHQCHVDLYIDDTGYDLVHSSPKTCAHRAYQVWQEVRNRLQQAKLPLSVKKQHGSVTTLGPEGVGETPAGHGPEDKGGAQRSGPAYSGWQKKEGCHA